MDLSDFDAAGISNGDLIYILTNKTNNPRQGLLAAIPYCIADKLHFGMYMHEPDEKYFHLHMSLDFATNQPMRTRALAIHYENVLCVERLKSVSQISDIIKAKFLKSSKLS